MATVFVVSSPDLGDLAAYGDIDKDAGAHVTDLARQTVCGQSIPPRCSGAPTRGNRAGARPYDPNLIRADGVAQTYAIGPSPSVNDEAQAILRSGIKLPPMLASASCQ